MDIDLETIRMFAMPYFIYLSWFDTFAIFLSQLYRSFAVDFIQIAKNIPTLKRVIVYAAYSLYPSTTLFKIINKRIEFLKNHH